MTVNHIAGITLCAFCWTIESHLKPLRIEQDVTFNHSWQKLIQYCRRQSRKLSETDHQYLFYPSIVYTVSISLLTQMKAKTCVHSDIVHQWVEMSWGWCCCCCLKSNYSASGHNIDSFSLSDQRDFDPQIRLQMTSCSDWADALIFKLVPLSGLRSPVTNTLVRVKLRLELEAGHPLIIFWLLVLPKGRLVLPLVTFWPFRHSEMSINLKDGWPGLRRVYLISDIPWAFFFSPSSEAKKSHITHRKSNYAAFRLDERFREGRITFNCVPLCISETNLCYYTA